MKYNCYDIRCNYELVIHKWSLFCTPAWIGLKLLLVMKLSLVVSTAKTNQDWDQEFLGCRDIIFETIKNFLTGNRSLLKLTETLNQDHFKNLDLRAFVQTRFWRPTFWNCRDVLFETVKTHFLKLSRPTFWNC